MFLLLELGIQTENLLKMRLLTEVDAAGEAVEGMHALVYPLCMFLLLELGIRTEYLLKCAFWRK